MKINVNVEKNTVKVIVSLDKRQYAREPKVRIFKEFILEHLKIKYPHLDNLKLVKNGYCSNISGEPETGTWEFELVSNKKTKLKEAKLDNPTITEQPAEQKET